jgi:hypothetical protein
MQLPRNVPGKKARDPRACLGGYWKSGSRYSEEEVEFLMACEKELRRLRVKVLSPPQVLAVAHSLGYRKG